MASEPFLLKTEAWYCCVRYIKILRYDLACEESFSLYSLTKTFM
jgi:hypothetical protein